MSVRVSSNDVGSFLAVFAALLLDNVLRLDETVGRVTDLVIGSGRPDKELVVTLQSFDRLKQEFEALGDALTRYAGATNSIPSEGQERAQLGQEVVAAITLAELKDRLLCRLQEDLPQVAAPPVSQQAAAELDVDVEF
ncbi:MAG: hypothetical protein K2Y71_19270 [Xanthobacteraceae bacterium]|nr:hypothetical protein [Xanthobacteraceae bacterium]